jgi:rhamnose transport system permease protein
MGMVTSEEAVQEKVSSSTLSVLPPSRRFMARFQRWEWLLVILILLVVLVNSRLSPYFLNTNNLFRTSSDFMEMGYMMLPMTFIIITGNIDLSVASTLGMTASFMGWLFNQGVNIWIAAGAALILGAMAGLLNGYLIAFVRLPALVVTLGTYAFYRGIAYVLLGDQAARGYPQAFTYLGQGRIGTSPVPFSVILFIVLAIIFGLVLHKTTFGRYLYAIGNNQDACLYSGVPVARIKLTIFTLSGIMAALAAIVMAARFGSTRPDIGMGLELSVITAVVLGGVDISGGVGTMAGGVLSLLLIGLMRFGMSLMNIQGQVQSIAIGFLLILSILLTSASRRFSIRNIQWNRQTRFRLTLTAFGILVAVLFGIFFFWSRSLVLGT